MLSPEPINPDRVGGSERLSAESTATESKGSGTIKPRRESAPSAINEVPPSESIAPSIEASKDNKLPAKTNDSETTVSQQDQGESPVRPEPPTGSSENSGVQNPNNLGESQENRKQRPLTQNSPPPEPRTAEVVESANTQSFPGTATPDDYGDVPPKNWIRKAVKRRPGFEKIAVPPAYTADRWDFSDGGRTPDVQVWAASSRGVSHAYEGSPREDSYAVRTTDDEGWVVAAVADGVGSSLLSDLGSRIAAESAAQEIVNGLNTPGVGQLAAGPEFAFEDVIKTSFDVASRKITEACAEHGLVPNSDLSTTLIVAVFPTTEIKRVGEAPYVWFASIGDSPIITLNIKTGQPKQHCRRSPTPGDGPIETVPTETLVSHTDAVKIERYPLGKDEAILLTSDGFGDALLGGHEKKLSEDLRVFFTSKNLFHPLEFLRILEFQDAEHSDDRTAVAIWRP